MSSQKNKKLPDFTVEIGDGGDIIDVTFMPNRAENEKRILGDMASSGRPVNYIIRK